MICVRVVLLAALACLVPLPTALDYVQYLVTAPQNPKLQIGTNFTATCLIKNTTEVTVDDLKWKLARTEIPKEQYTKINDTALNVTITITNQTPQWLICFSNKDSTHVLLNGGRYQHGINLKKDYFPKKPTNLSCMAVQDGMYISPIFHCQWEPKLQQHFNFNTIYRVHLRILNDRSYNLTTNENSADINTSVFPNFMSLDIWVEAENALGKVESEHLTMEANSFIKTNPPSHINIISEGSFHTSLLLNWTRPIDKANLNLIYEVRFTPTGYQNWAYVPLADTRYDIQSFRLQNLQPYTEYTAQVRCKNERDAYWSEWSKNSTERTPPYKPTSKPDVWQVMTEREAEGGRQVQLLSKDPKSPNGQIKEFEVRIQNYTEKRENKEAAWETIPVTPLDPDSSSKRITQLKNIHLPDQTRLIVKVVAVNSVGRSPEATIVIPEKENVPPPVQKLNSFSDGGKLFVEWSIPNTTSISGFLVQWTNDDHMDWQREDRNIRKTSIRGNLEKFVRYNVSVYPLYYTGLIGKPAHVETYLEQGAPDIGPPKLHIEAGCNEAFLTWDEIPINQQKGFITNYTIFYKNETKEKSVTVPGDTLSFKLTGLDRNTNYDAWVWASTIKGSAKSPNHSFRTMKYAPGEIEVIVVTVSLGFLFVVALSMLICICKRDVIKKSLWPEIPNPGESTIGTWSPDYPLKAETPSEKCLSGISVLDVDVCDGKSVFEEDKSCLPLKKDKYMSEEHSSGIGGSSCMSSPRQSVSDSDEGGDMADTTASTVQYSSVVASSGYKGQTPSLQPQPAVFSRSESTQPLLESEENPDMLSLEGSRQSQRFPHLCLSHCEGNSDNPNQLEMEAKTLDFCPVKEDSEEITSADGQPDEWLASAPMSSYMPQLGGYRPQ